MSKDIKKALEHCIEWNCVDCPNREELGSGETVCRGRLLTDVLEYLADLETKLAEKETDIIALDTENYSFKQQIDSLRQQLAESENKVKGFVELFDKKQHENYEQFCEIMQLKQQLADALKDFNDIQEENDELAQQLAEERKKVVGELKVDIRSLFNSYASSLIDYCIWNKNAGENQKLYNNFKRIINDRLVKVLDLFDKRIDQIERVTDD